MHKDCYDLERRKTLHLRCKACRYQKCLEAGMNPEAIQQSEENIKIIEKERLSKQSRQAINIKFLESQDNKMQNAVEMLTYLESKLEKFRTSAYKPKWSECGSLEHLIASTSKLGLADEYGPMPKWRKTSQEETIASAIQEHSSSPERHYGMAVMSISPLIRCRIQLIEYVLLKAICACNPVPNLSSAAQNILSIERRRLVNILFDYCLRSGTNGPGRFSELIGIFNLLESQQKMQRDMYLLYVEQKLSRSLKRRIGFLHEVMSS